MSHAHVKLQLNEVGAGFVEVNGEPLPVRKIRIDTGVGELTIVTLELVKTAVEADVMAKVLVDETTTEDDWEQIGSV